MSAILRTVNCGAGHAAKIVYTFELYVNDMYLPFCRRSWKESTAGTSEQIVKCHLVPEFGKTLLQGLQWREQLQDFLKQKGPSKSSPAFSTTPSMSN